MTEIHFTEETTTEELDQRLDQPKPLNQPKPTPEQDHIVDQQPQESKAIKKTKEKKAKLKILVFKQIRFRISLRIGHHMM